MRIGFDTSMDLRASNSFKIGTWTPVWVQLKGGTERFSGMMDLIAADDDGTPTTFRMPVEVGANQSQRFTAYARPRFARARVHGSTARSRRPARRRGVARRRSCLKAPTAIMPNETLLLTLGQTAGRGGDQGPVRVQGSRPRPEPERCPARSSPLGSIRSMGLMPGRWYGYDAARAVVVETSDREIVKSLDALRFQPLVDWVARGGHLVVSVGANWQAVQDSVLGPILPGVPSGQERVNSLAALDTFAGSTKQITPPGSPPVMVTKLEGIEERGGKVLSMMSNLPLVVRGPYGFGRVTMITLDVDQKPFSDWVDKNLFWVRAIDLRAPAYRPDRRGRRSGRRRLNVSGAAHRPVEPASDRARAVPGREAHPVRLGGVLHLSLHFDDRAGRLLLPQEGAQADGADLDHVSDDRGDRQLGGVLCGLSAQGQRSARQQGRRRRYRPDHRYWPAAIRG